MVQELPENVIPQVLESARCIAETEGHDQVFEVSKPSLERCFPLVTLSDADQVVGPAWVQFGKDPGITESLEKSQDQREWVAILNCNFIELSVVYAGSEGLVFFFHKEYAIACRRGRRTDEPLF